MTSVPFYPLPFEPFLRPMPWGSRRLAYWLHGPLLSDQPIGEAWLLSDHHLHPSRVAAGPLAGWTLRQLMEQRAEELLGYPAERFPLLIKFLDVQENLSVQVHPDDADAVQWAPGEGGKTEAWLVLEADSGAVIYLGLKPGIDKSTLMRELTVGTVPLCLQRYEPQPGQCYFIPAGTVHAAGGGLVVLEVQQTSDVTFRLYDWGRVDAEGKARPLHLKAALACLKEQPPGAGLQKPQPLAGQGERLVTCDFFQMNRLMLSETASFSGPCVLVGLEGQAQLSGGANRISLRRGDTIFVPASITSCQIEPEGRCILAQIGIVPSRQR